MDKVFFDTNVCLDLIIKREPYASQAYPFLDLAQKGRLEIFFSEGSLPNIIYIIQDRSKLNIGLESLIKWV
ncbi:MAG: PIN domain-containing protein [Bacteroidota bacterium]